MVADVDMKCVWWLHDRFGKAKIEFIFVSTNQNQSLINYVPFVPTCLTFLGALITACLRALIFHMSTCNVLTFLNTFSCLRVFLP